MSQNRKLLTILSTLMLVQAHGAGFDNSYFPFMIFTGHERFEWSTTVTTAEVKPTLEANTAYGGTYPASTTTTNDMYLNRYSPVFGIHKQLHDTLGISYQYEEPFATNTRYNDNSVGINFPIHSKVSTQMHSLALNWTIPSKKSHLDFIGGMNILSGSASFSTDTGAGLGVVNGAAGGDPSDNVSASLYLGNNFGLFSGIAFEMPSIALKAQAMYYPQIRTETVGEMTVDGGAYVPVFALSGIIPPPYPTTTADISSDKITISPKRYHLYLQSGLRKNLLGFIGRSHAEWSAFSELQTHYTNPQDVNQLMLMAFPNAAGLNLFEDDGNYWYVGIARKVNASTSMILTAFLDNMLDNPVDDFRTPSRGSNSYSLAINSDIDEKCTLKGRVTYIDLPYTEIEYPLGTNGSYKGTVSPTAYNFNVGMEYKLS